MIALWCGAALVVGIAIGFLLRRKSKPLESGMTSQLIDTLLLLEGVEDQAPQSLPELLIRLDSISRNLQGRYDVLMNNLAASVIVYDENWRVRFISPYTEILTGYSAEDFYGSSEDLVETISVSPEKYLRAKKVTQLGEDFHLQFQVRHRSGVTLWLDGRVVPITNENEEVIGLLAVLIDVTESIRQRKQLEEQNQDLKDFSYMVSHDLKAPIFTIKGMVAALKEDYGSKLDSEGHQLLQFIADGAERLEKLVSSVIEYSAISIREGKAEPVRLIDALETATKDLSEQNKIANGTITLPKTDLYLSADPVRLYQVFSNLIGNAIKYREPTRELKISIKAEAIDSSHILVEVTDNGMGIPANKLSDIFRPYHRAHSSDIEGSGIGLASVKKIVEKAGGTVSVTSEEGVGSTFSVLLPVGEASPVRDLESLSA